MPDTHISELFNIRNRFLRSAHLERDFLTPSALEGYVVTPHIEASIERLASGLDPTSGQRAWRITGDYGSGKSSFALLLAHLFAGRSAALPKRLRRPLDAKKIRIPTSRLLPILVTGAHERITVALVRTLLRSLPEHLPATVLRPFTIRLRQVLDGQGAEGDVALISIMQEIAAETKAIGRAAGLLIILDELGKFLEFAAHRPDTQDAYFLQQLAEAAARSGRTPLFVVGLLHQGFSAYSDQLSISAQREWEKVAGRFEELIFNQPMDQMACLVADALNVRTDALPKQVVAIAENAMARALDSGWYGSHTLPHQTLLSLAARLYPLHPTVLPALARLFARFGQNERSLFSFLLSHEAHGLQSFSSRTIDADGFYRLHDLYDYARHTFGARLGIQSYRSHWNQIEALIDSYRSEQPLEVQVLKSVGLLNLLDTNLLLATPAVISLAIGDTGTSSENQVRYLVNHLQNVKRVLYYRGAAGGYCLWPNTSVNLERAYEDARRALASPPQRLAPAIMECLDARPIVARRHYIKTGNLRHFEIRYVVPDALSIDAVQYSDDCDGRIVIPLCETEEESSAAVTFATEENIPKGVFIAIPRPLKALGGLLVEAQRWQWVADHTPELNQDTYASEEVSRQIANSRHLLTKGISSYVGVLEFAQQTDLKWYRNKREVSIRSARQLLVELSRVCESVYRDSPRIHNELVNRRALSSAAAAARQRLIELMFQHIDKPFLGMDPQRKPPEMSVYLSLLANSRLHRSTKEGYELAIPERTDDPCNLNPVFKYLEEMLDERRDARVKISELFRELRQAPFGVRDGISPLLLGIFILLHEEEVALYENGSFLRDLTGSDFRRIIKAPQTFEIQVCRIRGVRAELFKQVARVLRLQAVPNRDMALLDVVRALCVFAAQLPSYTLNTKRLSAEACAVREVLLNAKEPAMMVFRDLPIACGFDPFTAFDSGSADRVDRFVQQLRTSIGELRSIYPALQEAMRDAVIRGFARPGSVDVALQSVRSTASRLLIAVNDPRLKGFCLRLADLNLAGSEWIEALGGYVAAKPPSKWSDIDADAFWPELLQLVDRFNRLESFTFGGGSANATAIRIALTQQDGTEINRVLHFSAADANEVEQLQQELFVRAGAAGQLGLAAIARACWSLLSRRVEN